MNYYQDMMTKYGFHDGSAVPRDAEACRTVYIKALNILLEKFGSNIRMVAFDGHKNPFLIVKITKEVFDNLTWDPTEPNDGVWDLMKSFGLDDEPEMDDEGGDAVDAAMELMLDDIPEVTIKLPTNLDDVVKEYIDSGSED